MLKTFKMSSKEEFHERIENEWSKVSDETDHYLNHLMDFYLA